MAVADNTHERTIFGSETFKPYHFAWLRAHPNRTVEWLKRRLLDGFHIHHLDGDHSNNDPTNLVLIDGDDHMMLHAGALIAGIKSWRKKQRADSASAFGREVYDAKARFVGTWRELAVEKYSEGKPSGLIWNDYASRLSSSARRYAARNDLPWPPRLSQ